MEWHTKCQLLVTPAAAAASRIQHPATKNFSEALGGRRLRALGFIYIFGFIHGQWGVDNIYGQLGVVELLGDF